MTTPIKPAATVILMREEIKGDFEIFMVKRSSRSTFGSLYVFPGGKLDPEDSEAGNYFAIKRGGNSFAAPQISGLVALILEANSSLSYRDVQQVLINSSRHYDFSDPFLNSNAAGYKFSINTGFGVPDASAAVHLAKQWANKEPLIVSATEEIRKKINELNLDFSPIIVNTRGYSEGFYLLKINYGDENSFFNVKHIVKH